MCRERRQHTKNLEILRSSNDALVREKLEADERLKQVRRDASVAGEKYATLVNEHKSISVRPLLTPSLTQAAALLPRCVAQLPVGACLGSIGLVSG